MHTPHATSRKEETMKVQSPGLQFYVDKLLKDEPFSFARYGNGEWDCILQLYHKTRSGSQKFSPGLRKALIASLKTQRAGEYYTALQSTTFLKRIKLFHRLEKWVDENAQGLNWHEGEVFTRASRKSQLFPLIEAMKQHRVVVVGPKWLMKLPFASVFVPVRSRNCWQDANAIMAQLRSLRNVVISFSAGPATKVLIHRLQPIIGKHSWLIDFGSLWDPFCGKNSRRYHSRITPAVQRKNLMGK